MFRARFFVVCLLLVDVRWATTLHCALQVKGHPPDILCLPVVTGGLGPNKQLLYALCFKCLRFCWKIYSRRRIKHDKLTKHKLITADLLLSIGNRRRWNVRTIENNRLDLFLLFLSIIRVLKHFADGILCWCSVVRSSLYLLPPVTPAPLLWWEICLLK